MGIVHYLGRPDNRTLFELGKFWWEPTVFLGDAPDVQTDRIRSTDLHALLPEDVLAFRIRRKLRDATLENQRYAVALARRIVAFADGHPVTFTNDHADDHDEYRDEHDERNVVDTAYTDDWGDEW